MAPSPVRFRVRAALLATLVFAAPAVSAASLSGVVSDEGAPLAMAEVLLIDAASNTVLDSQFTDADGRYRFSVSGGVYHLNASKEEYGTVWVRDVRVTGDDVLWPIELVPEVFGSDELPEASGDCD